MPLFAAKPDPESTCGRCGYIVKGLSTFICPECGSDLREVGIKGPSKLARSRAILPGLLKASTLRLLIWTIVFILFGASVTSLVREYLWPWHRNGRADLRAYPKSGAYTAIDFHTHTEAPARGRSRAPTAPERVRYGTFSIQYGPREIHGLFAINYLNNTYYYNDAVGATHYYKGLPTEAAVFDHFKVSGIDTSNPAVRTEAKAIAELLSSAAKNPDLGLHPPTGFPFNISRGSGSSGIEEVTPLGPFKMIWPVIWLIGAVLILRYRYRKLVPTIRPPAATRTATIMFTDMVDFTAAAASASRSGVLDLVRRHRAFVQPFIKRRGGKIIKSVGDALLITFDSATEALLAGLKIQAALEQRNASALPDCEKFQLRIAVTTGEVALTGNDVFGHPVNLASRVQQLAHPGEVYFTEATYQAINRSEVPHEALCAVVVKGLVEKINLYRALTPSQSASVPASDT